MIEEAKNAEKMYKEKGLDPKEFLNEEQKQLLLIGKEMDRKRKNR
jgi:hypothetical protein